MVFKLSEVHFTMRKTLPFDFLPSYLFLQKLGVHKLEELADSMGLQARGGRGEHSPPGIVRLTDCVIN